MNEAMQKHSPFMRLLSRSDDMGDGWRKVSSMIEIVVRKTIAEYPELYEVKEDYGLHVRFSARGLIVKDYV